MLELVGQPEAERLLRAALQGPANAYLLVGPRGAGMDDASERFCAALLGSDLRRVVTEQHPDLVVVEPEGTEIRIEQIRAVRADLHLRPFEAARRVYVIREAEALGRDAANALLKSLEEPPDYAVFVLVANDRARLLPTVQSRCQLVRFAPLATSAIRTALGDTAGAEAHARTARGNLDLARRLRDDAATRELVEHVRDLARDAVLEGQFDPGGAAAWLVGAARERGDAVEARIAARRDVAVAQLPTGPEGKRERGRLERLFEALAKRRRRRAETDELRLVLDVISVYYRDVLLTAVGASGALVVTDRAAELADVADVLGQAGAEDLLAAVAETRRTFDLPVIGSLALEALWHRVALRAG